MFAEWTHRNCNDLIQSLCFLPPPHLSSQGILVRCTCHITPLLEDFLLCFDEVQIPHCNKDLCSLTPALPSILPPAPPHTPQPHRTVSHLSGKLPGRFFLSIWHFWPHPNATSSEAFLCNLLEA